MAAKKKPNRKTGSKRQSAPRDKVIPREHLKRRASLKSKTPRDGTAPSKADIGRSHFPIVGIGASAGGLAAFKQFFAAMPAGSGIGFVLIPHLDPTHESLMAELLGKATSMSVTEAKDGAAVEPNCVYIIPPNRYLAISRGVLQLSKPPEPRGLQTAIDFFLRSLAADQKERAIGVVLSGTGSHGTLGAREIKLAGGMVMAQQPDTAEYDQMPRSAIGTGLVDYVLPPKAMPKALLKYVEQPYLKRTLEEAPASEAGAEQIVHILTLLRYRTKYDFRCCRKNMLLRRVQRRMGLRHIDQYAKYLALLREDAAEVRALYKDLLIGVTAFFRDLEAFKVLSQRVLAELVERADGARPVRVWVPGCATGEEAYSIAMLFLEEFALANKPVNIQVFATDIDEDSLETARQGVYPESIASDISPERLRRFFVKTDENHYQVGKQLRETVVFAPQNLISDAPFSKIDLVSCRNLLIYLEPDVHAKVIRLFHFALKQNGHLFLGPSESIGRAEAIFEPVSKKWRVYRRIGPVRRELVDIPIVAAEGRRAGITHSEPAPAHTLGFAELMQKALLEDFAPASVLVNHKHQVLCFLGPTADYLEFPRGQPTNDLLSLARQGLRTTIRAACDQAVRDGRPVTDVNARVKRNGDYVSSTITVRPITQPKEAEGLLLVTFQDRPALPVGGAVERAKPELLEESNLVHQLEYELKVTREDLQSTIEEMESSNEELKASNEEVMSMNAELQSANEELETSKEELQSLNEELTTVNNQLQDKVDDLDKASSDMANLLVSTDIATVFLDTDLHIQRFTPAIGKLLNLIPTDVGRSITDFSAKFHDENLVRDCHRVLSELTRVEKEIWTTESTQAGAGRPVGAPPTDAAWYIRRIFPYRSVENRIDGMVITFLEITERKQAEEALRASKAELERRVVDRTAELQERVGEVSMLAEAVARLTEGVLITDDHLEWPGPRIIFVNEALCRITGYSRDELIGKTPRMLQGKRTDRETMQQMKRELAAGESTICETVNYRKDGSTYDAELIITPLFDSEGNRKHFVSIHRDISERKKHEQILLDRKARLRAVVDTAVDAIITICQTGTIETFNPAAERMFGYSATEATGHNVKFLMPSPYHEEHDGYIARYLKTGEKKIIGIGREVMGRRKDGTTFPVDLAVSEFEIGNERRFTGIIRDISRQKADYQRLLQSERLAAIGEAMTGLTHESRNALSRSQANLRRLARRLKDQPQLVELIEGALVAQDDVRRHFDEVRQYASPRAPQFAAKDVGQLVRDAWEQLTLDRQNRAARLEEVSDALDLSCEVDEFAIRQVFLNVLENALAASKDPVEITVRYSTASLYGRAALCVAIRDNGPGLTPDQSARVFDAFYTTKTHGTGLGLAIARRSVERHSGTITVAPSDGAGAEFLITFPRKQS
jgi:two-component system CheB/CheR fusion protein